MRSLLSSLDRWLAPPPDAPRVGWLKDWTHAHRGLQGVGRVENSVRGLVMREDQHGHTQQAWERHLALWIAKPDFVAYHVQALPNRLAADLRLSGMPVLSWTVNSPSTPDAARTHADAPIAEGAGLP